MNDLVVTSLSMPGTPFPELDCFTVAPLAASDVQSGFMLLLLLLLLLPQWLRWRQRPGHPPSILAWGVARREGCYRCLNSKQVFMLRRDMCNEFE